MINDKTIDILDESTWDLLFDLLSANMIVPIIGDDFFYVIDGNSQKKSVDNYLVESINQKYGFSSKDNLNLSSIAEEIIYSNSIKRRKGVLSNNNIYSEIFNILSQTTIHSEPCLEEFFKSIHFPLILTTSFHNGIETILNKNKIIFNPVSYSKNANDDIPLSLQETNSLLYYLFGRNRKLNNSFLVTENDLLEYLHLWHNTETRPKNLSYYLQDKFLMVLGCNYPNWLFRFFWHSIRNFNLYPNNYFEMPQGVVASSCNDDELNKFLFNIQAVAYNNSISFVTEFLHKYKERGKHEQIENCNTATDSDIDNGDHRDFFISYAKEDIDIAKDVAYILRTLGATVWFDKSDLYPSEIYDEKINKGIRGCACFVPIITQNSVSAERRYFIKEWNIAINESFYRKGIFFAPIVANGTDTDLLAEKFKTNFMQSQKISYKSESFVNDLKFLIRTFRKEQSL